MQVIPYAYRPQARHEGSPLATGFAAGFTLVVSFLSVGLVFHGTDGEPFMQYRDADMLIHVGGSTALIVLWGMLLAATSLLVSRGRIHVLWLLLSLWAAICILYLNHNLTGYLWEIENLVLRPPPYLRRF